MSAILSADDLNDYISPGVACIKPPAQIKETEENETAEVELQIDENGKPLEISKIDGKQKALSPAQISLSDCLACSGCITSAEEVLVAQHSHEELIKTLKEKIAGNSNKIFVASISHQSRASLATAYGTSIDEMDKLLINLFVNQMGFHFVVGTSLGRKISLIYESQNIIKKKESKVEGPTLSSICPGWVLYAEKTHPYVLSRLSDVKSPQQITGCILKLLTAQELDIPRENIYHLSIMPCFDKKLESARPEKEQTISEDVDCVLTPKELVTLLEQYQEDFQLKPTESSQIISSQLPMSQLYKQYAPSTWKYAEQSWANDSGSASGGYGYTYLMLMRDHLILKDPETYSFEDFSMKAIKGRNTDIYELRLLYKEETIASSAIVNGFRNIQNLVRKLKPSAKKDAVTTKVNPLVARRRARLSSKKSETDSNSSVEESADASKCDYVEIMACPNGCINGGGQISNPSEITEKEWLDQVLLSYGSIPLFDITANSTEIVKDLMDWCSQFSTEFGISEDRLIRTQFKEVEKATDPNAVLLGAKW